jgi:hypothetical protein
MPLEIQRSFPQYWKGENDEGSKNQFEAELLGAQLKRAGYSFPWSYHKITNLRAGKKLADNFHELSGNRLNVVVYNFVDMLSHARTDMEVIKELADDEAAYRSLTASWFEHSPLLDMMRQIAVAGHRMVITTDHGNIKIDHPVKVIGDKTTNTNLRYKQGKNLNFESIANFDIVEAIAKNAPSSDYGKTAQKIRDSQAFKSSTGKPKYDFGFIEIFPYGSKNFGDFLKLLEEQAALNLEKQGMKVNEKIMVKQSNGTLKQTSTTQLKRECKLLLLEVFRLASEANIELIKNIKPRVILLSGDAALNNLRGFSMGKRDNASMITEEIFNMNKVVFDISHMATLFETVCDVFELKKENKSNNKFQVGKVKVKKMRAFGGLPSMLVLQVPHFSGYSGWTWNSDSAEVVGAIIDNHVLGRRYDAIEGFGNSVLRKVKNDAKKNHGSTRRPFVNKTIISKIKKNATMQKVAKEIFDKDLKSSGQKRAAMQAFTSVTSSTISACEEVAPILEKERNVGRQFTDEVLQASAFLNKNESLIPPRIRNQHFSDILEDLANELKNRKSLTTALLKEIIDDYK